MAKWNDRSKNRAHTRALSFSPRKSQRLLWKSTEQFEMKEDLTMSILSFIFFGFLSVVAVVACVRTGKLMVRAINGLFDRIEEKIG